MDEVNKIVKQPYKSKTKYKSQDYKKIYKSDDEVYMCSVKHKSTDKR